MMVRTENGCINWNHVVRMKAESDGSLAVWLSNSTQSQTLINAKNARVGGASKALDKIQHALDKGAMSVDLRTLHDYY